MIINLSVPNNTVQKTQFPDGQVSVALNGLQTTSRRDPIWIVSRFNNYDDLFYILAAKDALDNMGFRDVFLKIPCFLGQRSDRRFDDNASFDLRIITKLINAQGFRNVHILHPHSDVLPALLENCIVQDNSELVDWAFQDIKTRTGEESVLVSPDAGAYKAIFKHGARLKAPIVTGNKSRNHITGELSLEVHGDVDGKTCLIVDDYCDGGRTFVKLGRELLALGAAKVNLCVTHGLFSAGFDELDHILETIYCTNSIQDTQHNLIRQFKVI